jgi:hypothetical protein
MASSKDRYLAKLVSLGLIPVESAADLSRFRESGANDQTDIQAKWKKKTGAVDYTKVKEEEEVINMHKKPLQEQEDIKEIFEYNKYINQRNKKFKEAEKNKKWWE